MQVNNSEQFVSVLDGIQQQSLSEAASFYLSPHEDLRQEVYDIVVNALSKFEIPEFDEDETAVYSFLALHQSQLMSEWFGWLDTQLKIKTGGDVYLTEVSMEDARAYSGGAIMGPSYPRFINRTSDGTRKLVIVGPYVDPVEIYSA